MSIDVIVLPTLRDNYTYLIADRERGEAVVIDPSDGDRVLDALAEHGLALSAIWCTHHHWDHVGGIPRLRRDRPELPVLGSAHDLQHGNIEGQRRGLADGEVLEHGGARFTVVAIPGHTLGAIAFVAPGQIAFTGDTLFLAGCGRVFEGTMPMMRASLAKLRALPEETLLYCGHEYTVRNLEFAAVVEPGNAAVRERLDSARGRVAQGLGTVPAALTDDLATNPFLRWDSPEVQDFARRHAQGKPAESADEVFARVREAKDRF